MKSFRYKNRVQSLGRLMVGASVTRKLSGSMKKTILPALLFFLTCSAAYGQSGTVHPRSFVHDDSLRSYLLYVPNTYTGQEAWPLVIHYHGFGINATIQMQYSGMNAVADTAHFLVAYPNGLPVDDIVFGASGPGWHIPEVIDASHDDVAFTDSLIDHIDADFSIDLRRVHATGWSNGALMSYYLACQLPDRIASIASVAVPMTEAMLNSCQADRALSTLIFHGTNDPIFPWTGVPDFFSPPPAAASFWASNNMCTADSTVTELANIATDDSCTVTLIAYQNCDRSAEVLFYRINDGGHTWPGSIPRPGWEWLRHTNQDIDANSIILNFFKRNPMPAVVGVDDNVDHLATTFRLQPNFPNPFNPATTITYAVPQTARVELTIYNTLGQSVRTLVDELQPAGEQTAVWDGKNAHGATLPSGVYLYRLRIGEFTAVRKMVLAK